MAITAYPFDNQDTNETQYSRLFRELQDSGIADSIGGSAFQVIADVGMNIKIQPGFAIERGHAISSTAVETATVTPASTNQRIDRVVLRLDPTLNTIVPVILPGVPGGGVPALTQTDTGIYEMPLARITVDAGVSAIAANKIVDERPFVGQRTGSWTTDTRPASPRKNKLGRNETTGRWEFYNGSTWVDLIPAQSDSAVKWGGYTLTVSTTQPSGTPTPDRIWIQPVG